MNAEPTESPGRLIKRTRSICPQCLQPLDAGVYERDGAVWLDKVCARHGPWSALLSSDIAHYHGRSPQPAGQGGCCGGGCSTATTPQWANHSCTVLIEITERCNLTCPTCFAGSSPRHSRMMTLRRGVNDHEVGDFLRLGLSRPGINNLVLQPAMYSGRYDNPRRVDRLTLADAVHLVCEQFGTFEPRDFTPIPRSDPNCFAMAVAFRTADALIPLSRHFPALETWGEEGVFELIARIGNTINGPRALAEAFDWAVSGGVLEGLDDAEVEGLLDALLDATVEHEADLRDRLWKSLFVVSIKPFMDAYTYDQDRIDGCCVHILDENGEPVSFCEFNAIHRPLRSARQAAGIRLVDA